MGCGADEHFVILKYGRSKFLLYIAKTVGIVSLGN